MDFAHKTVQPFLTQGFDLWHAQIHHPVTSLTHKMVMGGNCGIKMISAISTAQFLNLAACCQQIQIPVDCAQTQFRILLFKSGIDGFRCRMFCRRTQVSQNRLSLLTVFNSSQSIHLILIIIIITVLY